MSRNGALAIPYHIYAGECEPSSSRCDVDHSFHGLIFRAVAYHTPGHVRHGLSAMLTSRQESATHASAHMLGAVARCLGGAHLVGASLIAIPAHRRQRSPEHTRLFWNCNTRNMVLGLGYHARKLMLVVHAQRARAHVARLRQRQQ
jgi:hypothetical protein